MMGTLEDDEYEARKEHLKHISKNDLMKALKLSFVATLTRYNFGDPILGYTKEFENYPTEAELLDFLNDCNTKHEFYKDFHTKIVVDEVYTITEVK